MRCRLLLVVALMSAVPHSAGGQTLGARGYLTYGQTALAAKESLDSVGAEATQVGVGGGGTVTGLWRGLFVDVAASQQKLTGERVFLNGSTVYRLGIPLYITIRPIDLAAGWRFVYGRVSPYVGGGVSVVSYRERDDFSQAGDEVNERTTGGVVVGGIDVPVMRWFHVGGEVRYRIVSGILGAGGVSKQLDEDSLGGVAFAARISVGR
jgi:hypothetical protein